MGQLEQSRPFFVSAMSIDAESIATPERVSKLKAVIQKRQPTLSIVLENVHDPHNVSAVLRSCDATGVLDIHLVYYGKQKFPEVFGKSSGSARKWVNRIHHNCIDDCYSVLRAEGKTILTTALSTDAISLYDVNCVEPVAFVFGNEHDGVSSEALEKADANVLIPQVGMVESLNISVACAVTLFEAFRQRSAAGMYSTSQISPDNQNTMLIDWLMR